MNSIERHELRYKRRKKKREDVIDWIMDLEFDDIFSFDNMWKAAKKACKGSRWKTSTILYETFIAREVMKTYIALRDGTRKFKGYNSFITVEHGKCRDIDALHITERAMQKCFFNGIVNNVYVRSFIYDNSSSLKDKGMDFAFQRLLKQLRHHYRKYNTKGGILLFDFKSYFASLPHDKIKEIAKSKIKNDVFYDIFCQYVDDYTKLKKFDKESAIAKGVGLGSGDLSQIIALDYASPIDHYIKSIRRIKGYGRYMDDGYVISDSFKELEDIKKNLFTICSELGITLNSKKVKIIPFKDHAFTFLKIKFKLKESGKIVTKLSKRSIFAIKRKIHIFRKWLDSGVLDIESITTSYQSWRSYTLKFDTYKTIHSLDELFLKTFEKELGKRRLEFKSTFKVTKDPSGLWRYFKKNKIDWMSMMSDEEPEIYNNKEFTHKG